MGKGLPVLEEFVSFQAEGIHAGRRAYFIRLMGCDIGCHWCDTKDSWSSPSENQYVSLSLLVSRAVLAQAYCVVVTGGEPLMHNLGDLCQALHARGLRTHIETSGVYAMSGTWDWVCLSPKKHRLPHSEAYACAHELKVVVYNADDLDFALSQASRVSEACHLCLQPEWSRMERSVQLILSFLAQYPNWRMSLQTHKWLSMQ